MARIVRNPYLGFNFIVEIEGIISAGFTDVSGLSIETAVETIKEGGVNNYEHKLPIGTKYSDITLKRGLVDLELWEWYKRIIYGIIERKEVTISLRDPSESTVFRWHFHEAFPIKWEGPKLSAASSTIASETLVLAHHGIQ